MDFHRIGSMCAGIWASLGPGWILAAAYLIYWWEGGFRLTPDGTYYMKLARREAVPMPYAMRVMPAWLLGEHEKAWIAASFLGLVGGGTILAHMTPHPYIAALLFAGLPFFRINTLMPILVDAPAFGMTMGLWQLERYIGPGFRVGALGAPMLLTKETTMLFVGAWAGDIDVLLAGAILFGLCYWFAKRSAAGPDKAWLADPLGEARKVQHWTDWKTMVLPWGALLPLALWNGLTFACVVSLVIGYAQLLVAQDKARLYQWAAPPLILVAAANPLPGPWMALALLAHVFNPYRGV